MLIKLLPSKYCEIHHREQNEITAFIRNIEYAFSSIDPSPIFNVLEVLLLLAPESDLKEGKYKEISVLHWKYGVATIGVNGDYERYLNGDDTTKVDEIYSMLLKVCILLERKKKAKFDVGAMRDALHQVYQNYLKGEKSSKKK